MKSIILILSFIAIVGIHTPKGRQQVTIWCPLSYLSATLILRFLIYLPHYILSDYDMHACMYTLTADYERALVQAQLMKLGE